MCKGHSNIFHHVHSHYGSGLILRNRELLKREKKTYNHMSLVQSI